ncbi:hypothetical protein [Streptomyces sp. NPDC018036]|uniref:hypothetical protein n=1 Tax=Streptomyces sp. NPDC018036 TaxID=3365035 RepID=UPI0037B640E2
MGLAQRATAVAAVLAAVSSPVAGTANAASAANPCAGQSEAHIVKNYYQGPLVIPLRCGSNTWGYRHLVYRGRWSADFDKKISHAIWRGTAVPIPGGRWHYYMEAMPPCSKYFGVLDNPNAYGRTPRINPQGIITAYSMDDAPGSSRASSAEPHRPVC